jgi:SNF2 family DNA or RNA helicase
MEDQLEPYQLRGADFLASHHRASLFDEPGLGKTAQVIRAMELVRAERSLVICPAGARPVWPYQFKLWGRTAHKVVRADSVFDMVAWQRGKADVLVLSYEQAVGWRDDLRSDFFDVLAIDESHYMKNPEAKRTLAIVGPEADGMEGIAGMANYVWPITGTPMKNDPADLWVPMRSAGVTKLTYTAFQKRYFKQRHGTFGTSNRARPEALPELQQLIKCMSLMRTFEDVGSQLPPIRMDLLPVDGDSRAIVEYLKQYPGLSEGILSTLEAEGKLSFDTGTHMSTLRALIAEAKAPGYAKLVTEELKSGTIDKLVIMANHRRAIQIICQHLQGEGLNAQMIMGGVSDTARDQIVRSFQDQTNGVRVIVGNIQAAGTALTLHAANRLDMFESAWTPTDNVQAVRRIRRKGQKRPTFARFVMLQNSFDEVVSGIVRRKANEFALISEKGNMVEAMVGEDAIERAAAMAMASQGGDASDIGW